MFCPFSNRHHGSPFGHPLGTEGSLQWLRARPLGIFRDPAECLEFVKPNKDIPSGKRLQKTMERSTIFHG